VLDTKILSGIEASHALYDSLHDRIHALKEKGITPGLAAILVGEDPASQIYVRNKTKRFDALGLKSDLYRLEDSVSEQELLDLIAKINADDSFHGILVQLPLPKHIDSDKVIHAIDPKKDVDGFHPENAGLLSIGRPRFVPCTPKGIMFILKHFNVDLNGKHVVVVGRSNIVGRPVSVLSSLKSLGNATVTLCHSGTSDLKYFTKQADVVVAAMGSPEFLDASFIKEGACLVDVGINRIERDGKSIIVGDVNQPSVTGKASSLTPVPRGVGPMTIAMLVENTIVSAELLLLN
jgi:methylenetetrahydrofolate dehydrogenase (NADP+)/methenyltetrahydrofolate cyclohydrolase